MAFDQSQILDVTADREGADVRLAWRTAAPAGSVYQVYVDRALRWHGTATSAVLALDDAHRVDVGTVAAGEDAVDFSAALDDSVATRQRVLLAWEGGSALDGDLPLVGFRVYGPPGPGLPVDRGTPLATVPATTQGVEQGGFGLGGFGEGGFGGGLFAYSWATGPLCPGAWSFAVVSYDAAGNEAMAATVDVTTAAPPEPPARDARGRRLTYDSYHLSGGAAYATLHWLASPSCS